MKKHQKDINKFDKFHPDSFFLNQELGILPQENQRELEDKLFRFLVYLEFRLKNS